MKYLHNPDNGAPIRDLWYRDSLYFGTKDNQVFKPGDIVKVEDEIATFVLGIYEFVEMVSVEQAKGLIEKKRNNKFRCKECDFSTDNEKSLHGHSLHHARAAKLDDELGVPVISGISKVERERDREIDTQSLIDQDASSEGLIGEGLVEEKI